MKITIAYLPAEEREAATIQQFFSGLFGGVKVCESGQQPPYKHIYLTSKTPDD